MLHRHNLLKGRCLLWRIHGKQLDPVMEIDWLPDMSDDTTRHDGQPRTES
jgi:hypothetical protein